MAEVSEKEQRFLAWLREHGAKFDKLEWPVYRWPGKPHDGERGVRVISDIAPCEEMFSIPEKILMSRKSCMASSIAHVFRKHKDVLFSSRDELALTLLILYEKLDQGNASFWKPMIDILPADPGAASKWSEEELQELQDESLKAEAMIVVASMQQTYQRVLRPILVQHGDVFSVDRYTWEEFRWALLCVESRTFGRFLPHPSIVPFADLLNHVNVQTSYRWLPEERRAAYMCDASGEHVHRRGEEAFMSYGPRSNAELLLHYGFALQSNRYEAVELNFRINTLHHSKNIPCTKIFKTCLRPQVPCFDLLVLFRKFVLDKSLGPSGKGGGSFTHEELRQKCFWDAKMEEEALSLLRKALIDCVRNNFPTTLAGDWREYKSAESMRKKFCLIYRMTRKRVLLQHARFMAIALHELQLQRCKVGSQQQQQSTAVYVEGDDERGGERLWVDSDYLNGATMRWRETLLADSNVGDLEQYDLLLESESEGNPWENMSEPVKAGEEEERTRSYNEICQRSLEFIHQQESSVLSSSSLSFHQSAAVGDNLATRTVTCGEDFTALVCEDGLLFTCGDNTCGKLGHARTEFDCRPSVTAQQFVLRAKQVVGVGNEKIVSVGCGQYHMVAISESGKVFTWGSNVDGQCGLNHKSQQILRPACLRGFGNAEEETRATSAACGDSFSVILCADGSLFAWGRNYEGQCGVKEKSSVLSPTRVDWRREVEIETGEMSLLSVSASNNQTCAIMFHSSSTHSLLPPRSSPSGYLLCWGCAKDGRLGLGEEEALPADVDGEPCCPAPRLARRHEEDEEEGEEEDKKEQQGEEEEEKKFLSRIVKVAMGRDKMIALDADGNLFFTGKLGNNDKECRFKKMRAVVAASQQPACARDISLRAEVAVLLDGEGRIWEGGVARESKILSLSLSTISGDDAKFSSLSCGRFHSLALSNGSQVFSWGSFARGELNADMSLGFLQSRMLDVISLPALGATKHTGVVCINCKSDNISGVRYISIARDADKRSMQSLCARCVERDNMLKSEVLLACHRKLPPHFRPSIANIDLTTGQTHHGTGCDSCSENPIAGIRYKCCNCDQYNLCARCYMLDRAAHLSTHLFLRIPLCVEDEPRGKLLPLIYPQITIDIFARNKNGD